VTTRRLTVPLLLAATAVALMLAHTGEIRGRAEMALGRGIPAREAALARGFVLGQDEGIDAETKEDFRRAGLSHLLAVSGQNVALLCLLAMPLLAALGLPLRSRLVWMLGLIVVYVPLAGAGPSIQRAGIMGALSVIATLAGRRSSRFYALALAALILLAFEPRIVVDVGWQLSFVSVLGILFFAAPLRSALGDRIGRGGWRRPLIEGAAMTTAATIATAPLVAFHFDAVPVLTLPANLLALPAVASAMWLGMLSAAAGQVPGFPVEIPNALCSVLLAYIAQVATWCGSPSWAYPHVDLGSGGLIGAYLAIAAAALLTVGAARQRRIASMRWSKKRNGQGRRAGLLRAATCLVASVAALGIASTGEAGVAPTTGLRVSVMDVGQGDAILLQPPSAPAVLVDGGPPGGGIASKLERAGVERLGAVVLTHDQSDHAGGIRELLHTMPIGRLLHGVAGPTIRAAAAAGIRIGRLIRGTRLRSGGLRLDVLWPTAELLAGPSSGDDPNALAVVLKVSWRRFTMLLTADAEAAAVPLTPGRIDVLKVAHHGSDDVGLRSLLGQARPRLAVISVGAENPFGHPAPATLSMLARHGIRTLRTDRDGEIVLDVAGDSLVVQREP
jgi:competence protein ComEC